MAKSRRGVRFPHKNGNGAASGSEGRRSSFSDLSEEGSPGKNNKSQAHLATVAEVWNAPICPPHHIHTPSIVVDALTFKDGGKDDSDTKGKRRR